MGQEGQAQAYSNREKILLLPENSGDETTPVSFPKPIKKALQSPQNGWPIFSN